MIEPVRLGPAEVDLFLAASHDANPLHRSADYARRTPFGEPVVYGVLGALAGLGRLAPHPGARARQLKLDFKNPVLVDQPFRVVDRSDPARPRRAVELRDGARVLTRVTVELEAGAPRPAPADGEGSSPRAEAARVLDPVPGTELRGRWEPGWSAIRALRERFGLDAFGPADVAAAAFASWLVGMELPGEPALFAKATIELSADPRPVPPGPLPFRATVAAFDARFDLLRIDAVLGAEDAPIARLELQAFVRRPAASVGTPPTLPGGDTFAGRRVLVIGASRGLGAALARALVSQGAQVIGTHTRSPDEAAALVASLDGAPGALRMVQADAADPASCASLVAEAAGDGGLDLLICNAAPSLRGLSLDPAALDRMVEHLAGSFRMVAGPVLAALPALAAAGGRAVLVSSVAVEAPPPEWAHYVSAKAAEEAFLRVAAAQHPEIGFLALRPARLRTDYTLNPHLHGAVWPEDVAVALLARLVRPGPSGALEVLTGQGAGG